MNNLSQAVDCDLFLHLYADDTSSLFQHKDKDLDQIKKELPKNFCDICDWFPINKLSIHFAWQFGMIKLNLSF